MAQEQLAVVLAHAPREVRFPLALELGVDQDQFTIVKPGRRLTDNASAVPGRRPPGSRS